MRQKDCHICLGVHEETTHEATAAVRAWFRQQVLMDKSVPPPKKATPSIDQVRKLRNGPVLTPLSTPGPGWKDFGR